MRPPAGGGREFALATAQVALSMTLVVPAGLFTKSLANVAGADPGLATDGVLMFSVSPGRNGYPDAQSSALFERLESDIAALPGLSGVTSSTTRILEGQERTTQVFVEGFDAGPDADRETQYDEIGGGYFRTLGIPVTAGREFTAADSENAARVAVVNEQFARKFGLGSVGLGSVGLGSVGLGSVGLGSVGLGSVGLGSGGVGRRMSRGTPALDLEIVQVRRADPNLPLEELRTLDQSIRGSTTAQRVMSVMTAPSPCSLCWRRSGSTACSPMRWCSVRPRSACG